MIDDAARAELARLKERAEAFPIGPAALLRITSGAAPPPGDDPKHVAHLFGGWRIVYTIEDHGRVTVRHLSVSVDSGKSPNVLGVAMIARELGFTVGDIGGEVPNAMPFGSDVLVRPDETLGWAAPNIIERIPEGT